MSSPANGRALTAAFGVLAALGGILDAPSVRRRALDRALGPVAYPTRVADEVQVAWEPTPRLRASELLGRMSIAAGAAAFAGASGLVALDSGVVALAYVTGAGLLLAAWVAWRVRGLRERPQPHRELVAMSRAARWSLPVWCVVFAGLATLEVAGAWARPIFVWSMAVAGIACLPPLTFAWAWSSSNAGDLAAVDVLRASLVHGVRVDEPRAIRSVGATGGQAAGSTALAGRPG